MFGVTNWKTTIGGIGSILGSFGILSSMISSSNWDAATLSTALIGLAGGVTGLLAKDHNVSNSPTPGVAKSVP